MAPRKARLFHTNLTTIPFTLIGLALSIFLGFRNNIVALYCFMLPFGLITSIGAFTPVVVCFVSYAFFGRDAVGDEIENPFGLDPNDLPLGALSRMIEVNLRQRLGEAELPSLLAPEGDRLT